jgi:hypothetical protein
LEVLGYELLIQGRIERCVPAALAFDDYLDGVVPGPFLGGHFDLDVGAQARKARSADLDLSVDDDSVATDVVEEEGSDDIAEVLFPTRPPFRVVYSGLVSVPQRRDEPIGAVQCLGEAFE